MTHTRPLWITTTVFGLATALLAAIIFPMFPSDGANISDGYGGAVYAMEMARSPADLVAVFGDASDPQRAGRIAAMDRGNRWDYAFMPAYTGFMALFLWAAYRETGQKVYAAFAGIGALSGIADAVENVILLGLTKDLETAPMVEWLAFPVYTKFLAITVACIAATCFMAWRGKYWTVAAVLPMMAFMSVILSMAAPHKVGFSMGLSIGLSWLAMLIFAALKVVRPHPTELTP